MRYMILIASDESDACNTTEEEGRAIVAAYQRYTEELTKAGVIVGGEALHESARGARVTVSNGKRSVTDGPFTESKEVIGGFYLIEAKSREEALEWAARCPAAHHARAFVELREVMEIPA